LRKAAELYKSAPEDFIKFEAACEDDSERARNRSGVDDACGFAFAHHVQRLALERNQKCLHALAARA